MKIIKKLKALFSKDDQQISLDLKAAEIKEGRAFLHPKHDETITYLVKSNDIEILLNNKNNLSDKDILILQSTTKQIHKPPMKQEEKRTASKQNSTGKQPGSTSDGAVLHDADRFKKRVFTVSLYPEEYDRLTNTIQKYGYRRAEFIMASADTATAGTMAKAQKKIKMAHTKMRKEERELKQKQVTENA